MKSSSTEGKTTDRFEHDMISKVNFASDMAKLTEKLARVSTANVRLLYQLRERDAKEAERARKQRRYRFWVAYVALLAGAVSAVLGATYLLPVTVAVALVCSSVGVCLCCLAFEILANKE